MKLSEITMRVVWQMGEEEDAYEEYRPLIHGYVNEAYVDIWRVYRPYSIETVAVGEDGCFRAEDLSGQAQRILDVQVCGVLAHWEEPQMGVFRVQGGAGREAIVRYRVFPKPLQGEGEAPELPEPWHGALADYATYRMLSNGGKVRQQRAEFYYSRYLLLRSSITSDTGDIERRTIRNKYGV